MMANKIRRKEKAALGSSEGKRWVGGWLAGVEKPLISSEWNIFHVRRKGIQDLVKCRQHSVTLEYCGGWGGVGIYGRPFAIKVCSDWPPGSRTLWHWQPAGKGGRRTREKERK